MHEFFTEAIHGYNLPFTVLMGLVTVFWGLSLLGTLDFDALDFDFDADADFDGDVSTEVSTGHNVIGGMLKAVNAQDVPIMMVLSILTLFSWLTSIVTNFYFNPEKSLGIAGVLLVGNLFTSVLMTKLVTQPLRPVFRSLKKDEENVPLVGSIGTVKSRIIDENYGQVTVTREGGSPALLNARLEEGALTRGETIIVTSYDENKKRYLVKAAPELTINNNQ